MVAGAPLGRLHGVFVPTAEVESHLVCGWAIVDDLIVYAAGKPMRLCGTDDVVLMAPPAVAAEGRAA